MRYQQQLHKCIILATFIITTKCSAFFSVPILDITCASSCTSLEIFRRGHKRFEMPSHVLDMPVIVAREEMPVIVAREEPKPKKTEEEGVPRTISGAIRRFFFGKDIGPILVVASLISLIHSRFVLLPFSPLSFNDMNVLVISVIFWWFQEHIMHEKILHSEQDWFGKSIHQEHHDKPYFHVSIDSPELIMGWLLVVHILLRLTLAYPLALSATIGYAVAGLFYEWAHYIVHTRVKPTKKNSLLAIMRANHIRHHVINQNYWFAFSVPAIDDIFGTNPTIQQVQSERKNGGRSI